MSEQSVEKVAHRHVFTGPPSGDWTSLEYVCLVPSCAIRQRLSIVTIPAKEVCSCGCGMPDARPAESRIEVVYLDARGVMLPPSSLSPATQGRQS